MKTTEFWIRHLGLERHPEGGWYRETWRTTRSVPFTGESPFGGDRSFATAIHYLLEGTERSRLHRIHSDELWLWHAGSALRVDAFGSGHTAFVLGPEPENGECLQGVVPAGCWFGASLEDCAPQNYALVSCVVAPGFDFRDFTFARKEDLLVQYPQHRGIIEKLT
ncbi:cupin domain-containing protein [Pelodictyon luteolum]|uniref:DUF985 domain-containing protein n=1 Tax=Chlorobium luteolum (strain DSM 273 / BCRC 81028 / 2530) TaxID=319225 RepID=Q3B2J6_CHLL3|nr:cupin domain-containing protein [Pelodictyon luteolum]ABB24435.1 conserved hypothetical protein [Pelodictyon luteolum DSM 273]